MDNVTQTTQILIQNRAIEIFENTYKDWEKIYVNNAWGEFDDTSHK